MSTRVSPEPDHRLVCAQCGDVIGVYEPMVVVGVQPQVETSVAADPALTDAGGQPYHAACFRRRGAVVATDDPSSV